MFDLISFNVLADSYIKEEWFPKANKALLKSKARDKLTVELLTRLRADVLCLQEVELDLAHCIADSFAGDNYKTFYGAKKQGKPDGCTTLINADKFEFICQQAWYFEDAPTGAQKDSGHLALIVRLLFDSQPITIVNTHLKWGPADTAIEQTWGYRQLKNLLSNQQQGQVDEPWILCGDFNLRPKSEALSLLTVDGFEDVYSGVENGETCFSAHAKKRIDYIFHNKALNALNRPLPIMADGAALPSQELPSDHRPIGAQFSARC
jgi:mRNA deadenylase 3'-5' endonuclease subunit Ccr4